MVIAHPGHPLAARRGSLNPLVTEPCIVRERGSGTPDVAEQALPEKGVRVAAAMQFASTEAIQASRRRGARLGDRFTLGDADQLALGPLALAPLRGVSLQRALTAFRLVGRAPTAAARAFRSLLAGHARSA